MDFMYGLPSSHDRFSKYHFASFNASFFTMHVAEVFIATVVK